MRLLAKTGLAACLLTLGALSGGAVATTKTEAVKVGDKAPNFKATDDQGKHWQLKNHVGKHILVLYFYPADFTGGCTAQACGFRDNMEKLTDKGVEVVGISGDSAQTHAEFKKDHKLPFTLLADPDGRIAKMFGVPVNNIKGRNIPRTTSTGKKFSTPQDVIISRHTVVIDREGNVVANYAVQNAGKDAAKVLETVNKLRTK